MDQLTNRKALYSAYMILKPTRKKLLKLWEPKYEKVIAHHVTVQFGGITDNDVPPDAKIEVVGYVDSEDGLEVLVVTVDGEVNRPSGGVYHITLSLDPTRYKPVDSNALIQRKGFVTLHQTIELEHIKPSIVYA